MLNDLITCWQRQQPERILLESAFLIAQKHCNTCRSHVWQFGFTDSKEEIYFFRTVQPQIAGRVMYYAILYESFLSCPNKREEEHAFWEKERERYMRFAAKNETFINYLTSGSTDLDHAYFMSKSHAPDASGDKFSFVCAERQTEWSMLAIKHFAELNYREYTEGKVRNAYAV